jgi:hypothetical protein
MLIDPDLTGPDRLGAAAAALVSATVDMARSGRPLMRRVVPEDDYKVWDHYPLDDAVDARTGARWFYHAHPPEERDEGEHGHFHLFLDRDAFDDIPAIAGPVDADAPDARVVHIAALSIDLAGVPTRLFTVNRWVTDEWTHSAADILQRLERFDLSAAQDGDALVNRWLTAAVATFAPEIAQVLIERDRVIAGAPPVFFEARDAEILSSVDIDLQRCVTQLDR